MSKPLFLIGLVYSLFLTGVLYPNAAFAQSSNSKSILVTNALKIEEAAPLILPAIQKIREASVQRNLSDYFNASLAISQKVIRAGVQMSDEQMRQFQMAYLKADQGVSASVCNQCTTELCKAVCECKEAGLPINKCVADKAPPGGY